MAKILKYLLILEAVLITIAALILFSVRNSSNGWAGFDAIFPILGAMINGVIILVLSFVYALKRSTTISSASANPTTLILIIAMLTIVPMIGIMYASSGDSRGALWRVSWMSLLAGIIFSIQAIFKAFKQPKNRK